MRQQIPNTHVVKKSVIIPKQLNSFYFKMKYVGKMKKCLSLCFTF